MVALLSAHKSPRLMFGPPSIEFAPKAFKVQTDSAGRYQTLHKTRTGEIEGRKRERERRWTENGDLSRGVVAPPPPRMKPSTAVSVSGDSPSRPSTSPRTPTSCATTSEGLSLSLYGFLGVSISWSGLIQGFFSVCFFKFAQL